jgi:hypothetical protein
MARAGRADIPAMPHQLMDTDKVMDDAEAHIYTTNIIVHGEHEVKENDDHNLIGGALQARLAEVINRKISKALGIRRPHTAYARYA